MTVEASAYGTDHSLLKHSGLGIASFILSVAVGIFDFVLVAFAGLVEASTPGGMDEESVIAILIGIFIFGGVAANLAGTGLGVAGLVQRDRRKVFSVLGLAFNVAIVFGIIGLMILGAMAPA